MWAELAARLETANPTVFQLPKGFVKGMSGFVRQHICSSEAANRGPCFRILQLVQGVKTERFSPRR